MDEAHDDPGAKFDYKDDKEFHAKAQNLEKRVAILNKYRNLLQTPLLKYCKCHNLIDGTKTQVENTFGDFNLVLRRTKVSNRNNLTPDYDFENAVYKIQMNQSHTLTAREKKTMEFLENDLEESEDGGDAIDSLICIASAETPKKSQS